MDTLPCYEAHVQHFSKQTKKQSHPQPSDPSSRGSQHVSHSLICPDQSNIRKPPPCWSRRCWHPFNCADWPWGRGALIHPTVSACPRILATHGTLPHLLLIHFITLHSYLQSRCDLDTVTPSRCGLFCSPAVQGTIETRDWRPPRSFHSCLFMLKTLSWSEKQLQREAECCWGVDLCGNCQKDTGPIYLRSAC